MSFSSSSGTAQFEFDAKLVLLGNSGNLLLQLGENEMKMHLGDHLNGFQALELIESALGVGKTSLVLRYVQGTYAIEQQSTIGASFMTKRM